MKQPSDREQSPRPPERGRWSSRRKTEVVLRFLRGEDLDALSRELGVTPGAIARWRDQVLAGGQAAVRRLDARGAFQLRRAVEEVADALGVSRFTVYNYLNAGAR